MQAAVNAITPFFLPLMRDTLDGWLRDGVMPPAGIERAGLAAALVLTTTPAIGRGAWHRLLHDLAAQVRSDPESVAALIRGANVAGLTAGACVERLSERGVFLAVSPAIVEDFARDRDLDAFQQACRAPVGAVTVDVAAWADDAEPEVDEFDDVEREPPPRLILHGSREQAVVAGAIASSPFEHFDVSAFAGTGKTHLILALADALPGRFTYLAPFTAAAEAMDGRAPVVESLYRQGRVLTQFTLGAQACVAYARGAGIKPLRAARGGGAPDADLVTVLRCSLPELHAARRAVQEWCFSDAPAITPQHCRGTDAGDAGRIAALAAQIWNSMCEGHTLDGTLSLFPVRHYHFAKWLDTRRGTLPDVFGVILVDEAHDLSGAWRRVLDRYTGGCVFMGDPYQRLGGAVPRAIGSTKALTMRNSYRTGLRADRTVRETMRRAPIAPAVEFAGSHGHVTQVQRLQRKSDLPSGSLWLYGDAWSLLWDAVRLRQAGAPYGLLPATGRQMREILETARRLRVAASCGDAEWEGWSSDMASRHLEGLADLVRTNAGALAEAASGHAGDGREPIRLGMIEHAKNLAVGAVALMPCCLRPGGGRRIVTAHAVYLGLTRAVGDLWIPDGLFEQLEEARRASEAQAEALQREMSV